MYDIHPLNVVQHRKGHVPPLPSWLKKKVQEEVCLKSQMSVWGQFQGLVRLTCKTHNWSHAPCWWLQFSGRAGSLKTLEGHAYHSIIPGKDNTKFNAVQ